MKEGEECAQNAFLIEVFIVMLYQNKPDHRVCFYIDVNSTRQRHGQFVIILSVSLSLSLSPNSVTQTQHQ